MKRDNTIIIYPYHAPCGDMWLGTCDHKLCLCDWVKHGRTDCSNYRLQRMLRANFVHGSNDVLAETARQLDLYFARQLKSFDLPLMPVGTDFQLEVWNKLAQIPYGQTMAYGQQASLVGRATSVRAVANANGANCLSIVIPCHRVIGSDGSLTGYGGGLQVKRFLLELETQRQWPKK